MSRLLASLLVLLGLGAALAAADTLVRTDRSVVTGTISRTADEKGLSAGGETIPLDEVLLWETDEGVLRYAPDLRAHVLGIRVLAAAESLRRCIEILPRAVEAGAREDARALLDKAEREGLGPKDAESWDSRIEKLAPKAAGQFPAPGREVVVGMLLARARKGIDGEDRLRGLALLRVALQAMPENEDAKKLLEEASPSRWDIGEKTDWLHWELDVLQGHVRLLRRSHPDMDRARNSWRKDLFGIETDEIVFVTPMKDTGPVSMCVRLARLTCSALDRMFATENPAREETLPLVIYFYENAKEYVELSRAGVGGGPDPFLGMTAGHYIPSENISRFFWPGGPGAARQVRHTFVHELTHHWIERRCPRWHARDLAGMDKRVQTPGYWVVEGFATFIEEGRFDQERGMWSHFNPHARSLDVVAALSKQGNLIAWEKELPLTQAEFGTKLDRTKSFANCATKWAIFPGGMWEIRLFYEQAGATCHYLYWGENGKYRQKLLDYVTNFYTSHDDQTTIEAGFGMTPAELGKKVEEFAKAVMNGWRPASEK